MRLTFFCVALLAVLAAGAAHADTQELLSNDKPLGAGFGVQVKEWRTTADDLDDLKDMGVQFVRFGYTWDVVEGHKGLYNFGPSDLFMRMLGNRNLYAVYEIGGLHSGYSPLVDTEPNTPTSQAQQQPAAPVSPGALKAFEWFVEDTVKRYHGDHVIWEVWNEPDMNSNWPPKVDAAAFAKLISVTCKTIKRVDPQAVVVGPALASLPSHNDFGHSNFLAVLIKSPAGKCLDAISVHPYRHADEPPETVVKDYADLRSYIAQNTLPGNKVLPIISSEWGFSLAEVTPEQQAAYVIRSFIINRLSGIPVSIWYEYRDSMHDDQTQRGNMEREAHFGLRDYDDGDKLSSEVLKAILPHLADAHVEKRLDLGNDKYYALLLSDTGGEHNLLFWIADRVNKDPQNLMIDSGNGPKSYPVGLIPTLVCVNASPALSLALGVEHQGQEYYVPCQRQ